MAENIDSLQIQIEADSSKAQKSIDALCDSLIKLKSNLKFDSSSLKNLSNGINSINRAVNKLGSSSNNIDAVKNGILKLSAIKVPNMDNLSNLASSISKLGGKNVQNAIITIPQITKALNDMMVSLSKAPRISDNVVKLTQAMAQLSTASRRASSSSTNNGFKNLFNTITTGSNRASGGIKSLAYYFGKFYANFWILRRGLGLLKSSVGYASSLVEIQNVVDNTFGKEANKVEDLANNAIKFYGMSKLTTKQVASEFQAMGNAMGITNQMVKESNKTWSAQNKELQATGQGYDNTAESLADMSLNLTKLASDIGSFYNRDYDTVGQQLASGVFTGQTRVLRQYGLDLTQATLKEFALSQGIDADVKSMTQAQKTMLRYQYVMSRTQNIQGDFLRTSNSWANVTRVIVQNMQNLGSTIGQITIHAFKPFIIALNNAILRLGDFAIMIENSLGKIFGWKYEEGAGAISDVADSTEDLSDGLGDASANAKKLKQNLLGIDELNIIGDDNGASGSGSSSSSASGSAYNNQNGQWVKDEKFYESSLDNLTKLGNAIRDKLIGAMDSIVWDDVYKKASGFGIGLAEFLNGLFEGNNGTTLFGKVGKTIAGGLNSAILLAFNFANNFDFKQFGVNLADGINNFFSTFKWDYLSKTLNKFVDGLEDTIKGFFEELDWGKVLSGIGKGLSNLEPDTIIFLIGAGIIGKFGKNIAKVFTDYLITHISFSALAKGIGAKIATAIASNEALSFILVGVASLAKMALPYIAGIGLAVGFVLWLTVDDENGENGAKKIKKAIESLKKKIKNIKMPFGTTTNWDGKSIELQTTLGWKWKTLKWEIHDGIEESWQNIVDYWGDRALDISNAYKTTKDNVNEWYEKAKIWWGDRKLDISNKYNTTKETVSGWALSVSKWWDESKPKLNVSAIFEDFSARILTFKNSISKWWDANKPKLNMVATFEDFVAKITDFKNKVVNWWNKNKPTLDFNIIDIWSKVKSKIDELKKQWSAFWKSNPLNISFTFDSSSFFTSIKDALNTLGYLINELAIKPINNSKLMQAFSLAIPYLPRFENGGYPSSGSLFWAGENGTPELMGTVGGKTAVASGSEITGISNAIYDTSQEELLLLRQQNSLLSQLLEKDTSVRIGDREIARANQRGQRAMGMTLRTT